jgi:hypothetical protein
MPQQQSQLEKEILQYLLDNPEGKDTIQGIARFWILGHKIDRMVDDLQAALRGLVEKGYLNEKTIPAPTGHGIEHAYQLNSSRIGEIAELVKRKNAFKHP